jgi:membrane protease YdiL (CAAX protease family)
VAALVLAWRVIVAGRASVFTLLPPLHAVLGLIAIAVRPPALSGRSTVLVATAAGIGSGLALYAATRAFLAFATRWPSFHDKIEATYERRGSRSRLLQVVLGAGIAAPGEELFWRGLVSTRFQASMPTLTGPGLAWILWIAVNAASQDLSIVLGAVVGGAVWAGLAVLTKGVLAPILSHAVWTSLMLVAPPGPGREKMPA